MQGADVYGVQTWAMRNFLPASGIVRDVKSSRALSRRFPVVLWARVLLLLLFVQSAFGCTDLHAVVCEPTQVGMHDDGSLADVDHQDCDAACAHCHGSCIHAALTTQKCDPPVVLALNAPQAYFVLWLPSSPQHPLLRPPAALA
jgi:hypothetical protein